MPGLYNRETIRSDAQSISRVFTALKQLPPHFASRQEAVDALVRPEGQGGGGLQLDLAQWLSTSLEPAQIAESSNRVRLSFDLPVIDALFDDFCALDLWPYLEGGGKSADPQVHHCSPPPCLSRPGALVALNETCID